MLEDHCPDWMCSALKSPQANGIGWPDAKQQWWQSMHELFSVQTYMDNVFQAEVRLAEACKISAESPDDMHARLFVNRVQQWKSNVEADMNSTCAPAPPSSSGKWVWYCGENRVDKDMPAALFWNRDQLICKSCKQACAVACLGIRL
jgi:hypothetical protein